MLSEKCSTSNSVVMSARCKTTLAQCSDEGAQHLGTRFLRRKAQVTFIVRQSTFIRPIVSNDPRGNLWTSPADPVVDYSQLPVDSCLRLAQLLFLQSIEESRLPQRRRWHSCQFMACCNS